MVSGGDRVGVPPLTLEVGGTVETVTVTAEAALVQTQSGERSFAITTEQIENLPVARGNFTSLMALTPGVERRRTSAGGTRLGGASQNNIMMDGISAMDTGNNGQMLNMNIESIGEVKILTQGYQAEYGRSSGLQITAVTKGGTNQFHGSGYGVFTDSDWNEATWVGQKNGDAKPKSSTANLRLHHWRPGRDAKVYNGRNKLFFFYAHEFRPHDADQRRQPHPAARAVGARARRQLLPEPRQQRRPDPAVDGLHDGAALPEQDDSGRPAVCPRRGGAQPLSAPERGASDGDELQLPGACAVVQSADPAAGRPPRLPGIGQTAVHRQVLRAAAATDGDAGPHSGLLRMPTRRIPTSPTMPSR